MNLGRSIFSLPLLVKELTEIAARRRTYITRVVYALLLFVVFLGMNESTLQQAAVALYAMGNGQHMFEMLIILQLIGICLFLPAFTVGLITQEKERDSLALLLLTELSPWQILLQKLGSGLLSILTFLLIGMPLAALCYAYGGMSPEELFRGVCALFLTCLQVAAFSLLCSTWARTTVGAFVGTYVGAGLFVGVVALAGEGMDYYLKANWDNRVLVVFPPAILDYPTPTISQTLLIGLPSLGATAMFLLLARFFFVRRAFAPPRYRLRALFRWLDAVMQRANRLIGGIAFRTRDRTLPKDDPIAWRELNRTTLGRPHYLGRLLVALEIPTVALCLWAVVVDFGGNKQMLSVIAAALGTLAVLALSALSANAFVSERVSQTMEVLMTTPLPARDMVRQKARMLTRFMWVIAVPLMTVFAIEWWTELDMARSPSWRTGPHSSTLYLLSSVLTLAIYLPLVLWLSLWIGLKMRTRFRAIVTALAIIVTWCVLPIIVGVMLGIPAQEGLDAAMITSPLVVPAMNEISSLGELFPNFPSGGVLFNFTVYACIFGALRNRCLTNAERYLRGAYSQPVKFDY